MDFFLGIIIGGFMGMIIMGLIIMSKEEWFMIFKNGKVYDVLKTIALKVLPALEFLIITIFKIWGLPYGAEIGATIAAIDTGLGIMLGISSRKYNEIVEEFETEEKKSHEIEEE